MGAGLDCTVVVSTYNQLAVTRLALLALYGQETDKSYEIVVCDDGSDATTVATLRDVIARAPVPTYLTWQQDKGFRLAASRNNAIRLSRGRILIFMDGDGVPEPDYVQRHTDAHRHDRMIAIGRRFSRSLAAIPAEIDDPVGLWALLRNRSSSDRQSRTREATETLYRLYLWSQRPWLACFGCNISVTKSNLIEFDEAFSTWGHEDYDLFYALTELHGYEPSRTSAAVYELEAPSPEWSSADYANHLVGGLYFFDKWSHTGLEARFAVPRYRLDAAADQWCGDGMPVHGWTHDDADAYVATVRDWLSRHGYLEQRG